MKVKVEINTQNMNTLQDPDLKDAFINCAASAIVTMRELSKKHNIKLARRSDER